MAFCITIAGGMLQNIGSAASDGIMGIVPVIPAMGDIVAHEVKTAARDGRVASLASRQFSRFGPYRRVAAVDIAAACQINGKVGRHGKHVKKVSGDFSRNLEKNTVSLRKNKKNARLAAALSGAATLAPAL